MRSPFKNPKNNEKGINQSLHEIIYKKVIAENYQKNQDETFEECKRLFKQGASPKTLAELEKILRERQNEQAIAKHLESSKPGTSPEALAELKKSVGKKREHYNNYTQHFLPALKAKITKSKKLNLTEKTEIEKIIMKLITLDVVSKSSSVSSIPNAVEENIEEQMQLKHIEEQNNTQETPLNVAEKKSGDNKILSNSDVTEEVFKKYSKVVEEIEEKQTSKLSSDSESDSGIDSPRTSKESLKSPVSSRRSSLTLVTSTSSEESVNSIPSVAEENNNLQKENENQMQPEQAAPEEPKMQESENSSGQADPNQVKNEVSPGVIQVADIGIQREKNTDPSGQATQVTGSQVKDSMQLEETRDRKNATTTVQKLPVNEKKGEDIPLKQPNNRNLHVALVAGCALSTIGCIVAGAMISGLVGAGLLAMAAVFAIAAVAQLHSNFLSSKLTSINVSPLVDGKQR
ncbi:MAG: hypothetical protein LBE46_04510 [Wolbachia pipientis]|jgi:hypothetical protein|nr:hypothetical protein [Wolbachia pipientis]